MAKAQRKAIARLARRQGGYTPLTTDQAKGLLQHQPGSQNRNK